MPRPTSRALPERTFEGQPLTGREERLREQSLRQGLTLKLRYDSNTSPSLRATVAFELAAFVAPTGERTAAEVRAWRTGRGYSYSTVRRVVIDGRTVGAGEVVAVSPEDARTLISGGYAVDARESVVSPARRKRPTQRPAPRRPLTPEAVENGEEELGG